MFTESKQLTASLRFQSIVLHGNSSRLSIDYFSFYLFRAIDSAACNGPSSSEKIKLHAKWLIEEIANETRAPSSSS